MEREMKFALITGGSMVFGAIVFAMVTNARHHAPPPFVPVTTSRELDSLSQATHAPPPPVPDYTPTWISSGEPESTTVKVGGAATLSTDEDSNDSRPARPNHNEPKSNRVDPSAAYDPPSTTDPASSAPARHPTQ
jgi:hypothetical protein